MAKKQKVKEEQGGDAAPPRLSLKSPRTVEACRRQGYLLKELKYISLEKYRESVVDPKITPDIIELRWNAMEEKRKTKIENVMKERQAIIDEEEIPETRYSVPSRSRKKLDHNNSQHIGEYTDKKLLNKKDPNNRSQSALKAIRNGTKPLAVEVQLQREKNQLGNLKKAKKRMLDTCIKKAIQDEQAQKEKEDLLLK